MIRIFMVGYSLNKGGVETFINNLTANLDMSLYKIIYSMPKMIIDNKEWIRPLNRHKYFQYRHFWKSFFKENKFDVVYYNTCDIVSVDMLKFAKNAGVPIRIIHSHSTENQKELNFFHKITERYNRKHINKYATNLLACSKEAGNWMFQQNEFSVIKNGIDLEKYRYNEEFRKEYRNKINVKKEFLIGCVGRLEKVKNPFMAIKIMEKLLELNNASKFVFIGDGTLKEKIEVFIDENMLSDKIIVMGACCDVYKWYSALDCLLMPSLFEGLPFTLIEAQASGLPCVVSNAVSDKANIADLVQYVGLDEKTEVWAKKILEECEKCRIDTKEKLIDAGYSIENTVEQVSKIIREQLEGV